MNVKKLDMNMINLNIQLVLSSVACNAAKKLLCQNLLGHLSNRPLLHSFVLQLSIGQLQVFTKVLQLSIGQLQHERM
jgi:hypothetical protein